tara:strand:- start:4588 stop:5028 length:441 start_codon:yes stop_codon:yes gene_type:complete
MTTKAASTLKDALSKIKTKGVKRGEQINPWSSSKMIGGPIIHTTHTVTRYLFYRKTNYSARFAHGTHDTIHGNTSKLYGDCTYINGDVSGLYGDCTNLYGEATGIFGNCQDLIVVPIPSAAQYGWMFPRGTIMLLSNPSIVDVDVE